MSPLYKKLSFTFFLAIFLCASGIFIWSTIQSYCCIEEQAAMLELSEQKVIVLDAGHGGEDGGAVGKSSILEKDINLSITKKLQNLLELHGFKVIMTREADSFIGDNSLPTLTERKKSDMQKRLQILNDCETGIFVSIHQNHFDNTSLNGAQVFYSPNHESSELLASSIQTSIVTMLQNDNERISKKSENTIYLMRNAQIPAVIVECGFLSNAAEAQKLCDDQYQNQMAFAVFCGILEYYAA